MREAELKHARIAMLAIFGALAQEIGILYISSSIYLVVLIQKKVVVESKKVLVIVLKVVVIEQLIF